MVRLGSCLLSLLVSLMLRLNGENIVRGYDGLAGIRITLMRTSSTRALRNLYRRVLAVLSRRLSVCHLTPPPRALPPIVKPEWGSHTHSEVAGRGSGLIYTSRRLL